MELVQFAGEKPADAGGTGVACGRKIKCCWRDGSAVNLVCVKIWPSIAESLSES